VTQFFRRLFELLGQWPIALAACCVLAALVLLPGLGRPGLWEPQERQLSDRVAPPLDHQAEGVEQKPAPEPPSDGCIRSVPEDAVARSLTKRSIVWGRDNLGDGDAGRRFPLALLGLITVIAAAGTAMRAASARAGVVTSVVLLAMPLLALQSRMLTSEIGTACGSSLIIYGLVALTRPARGRLVPDLMLSVIALVAGLAIAFAGGGALLGLLVPIGAFAAAGSLGVPFVVEAVKRRPFLSYLPAVIATLAAVGLVGILAYQLYYFTEPYPGLTPPPARQVFGQAIVAEGCWSSALGAIWRPEDDLRYIFDSTFEQIAYGTFPWGILAPIAMFALIRSSEPGHRLIGGVTLAWAGGAWIATEAFQRKVGFTIWEGFPALAIAVGVWLDHVVVERARKGREAMPAGAMLIGLFVALAVLDFGKDMQSFTEKLTSLLVGTDATPYPKDARLVDLPFGLAVPMIGAVVNLLVALAVMMWRPVTNALRIVRSVIAGLFFFGVFWSVAVALLGLNPRLWVLLIGVLVGVGFAVSMSLWRTGEDSMSRLLRRTANVAMIVALAATIVMAAFWTFVWHPRLAINRSSKTLLETYNELRDPSAQEPLVLMGDLGQAPRFYTDVKPEQLPSREQIVQALKRPGRVFAIAPQSELCALHREMGDQPYFVVDDRNLRSLLISNRLDGTTDKNPLAEMIQHKEPTSIRLRPKARIVWDNKIELIGWELPARLRRGESFEVVTYYKILAPVGGVWTMLMHFDGPLRLRDGDHKPIKDRCPTSSWMPGDYVIDRHTMRTSGGGFPAGRYDLWIGFFTGSAPNFRNMTVSAAPGDMRDTVDRVKITSIILD
jgi:hypothetical protein